MASLSNMDQTSTICHGELSDLKIIYSFCLKEDCPEAGEATLSELVFEFLVHGNIWTVKGCGVQLLFPGSRIDENAVDNVVDDDGNEVESDIKDDADKTQEGEESRHDDDAETRSKKRMRTVTTKPLKLSWTHIQESLRNSMLPKLYVFAKLFNMMIGREPDDGSHEDLPPTTSSSPLETIATAFVSAPSFLRLLHNQYST
ncbi:hypothetical protein YC2023_119459 [Brassica napus]